MPTKTRSEKWGRQSSEIGHLPFDYRYLMAGENSWRSLASDVPARVAGFVAGTNAVEGSHPRRRPDGTRARRLPDSLSQYCRRVHRLRHAPLLEFVEATYPLRGRLRAGQRRQQHRGENRDNRDDDQQFDQSEAEFLRRRKRRLARFWDHASEVSGRDPSLPSPQNLWFFRRGSGLVSSK